MDALALAEVEVYLVGFFSKSGKIYIKLSYTAICKDSYYLEHWYDVVCDGIVNSENYL
jgi:hypothetical protein